MRYEHATEVPSPAGVLWEKRSEIQTTICVPMTRAVTRPIRHATAAASVPGDHGGDDRPGPATRQGVPRGRVRRWRHGVVGLICLSVKAEHQEEEQPAATWREGNDTQNLVDVATKDRGSRMTPARSCLARGGASLGLPRGQGIEDGKMASRGPG